eukprot:4133123-Prymnesium_polylepis.1
MRWCPPAARGAASARCSRCAARPTSLWRNMPRPPAWAARRSGVRRRCTAITRLRSRCHRCGTFIRNSSPLRLPSSRCHLPHVARPSLIWHAPP